MDTYAKHLAKLFMDNVVISFDMVVIPVIDAVSRFKSISKYMCAALVIIYWPLACGNHKGASVKKCNHFLNKKQAISGQYRGTHYIFLQNSKTSQYA